jgi:hypothetical protein
MDCVKVQDIVLPFAIRKVGRRSQYPSPMLAGTLVVTVSTPTITRRGAGRPGVFGQS